MQSRHVWLFARFAFSVAAIVAMLFTSASAVSREHVLVSYTGGLDGGYPAAGLVFDSSGNGYGTTVVGGRYGCGTVIKLTRTSPGHYNSTVLHDFNCGTDGKNPYGGVTLKGGNIFGTTAAGGSGNACTGDGCGVVYELNSSGLQAIWNFTGGNDGFGPSGAVVLDSAGNLYGATADGGKYSHGVIYKLHKTGTVWGLQVVHAFTGGNDGGTPGLGRLLLDKAGNLYGIAELYGAHGTGTVFKASPVAGGLWKFATIWPFKGMPDAGYPYGGVTADAQGNLYGTTYYGGANGLGSVYRLMPVHTGWVEKLLYSFKGGTDGSYSTTTPIFDVAGDLLGTTSTGGITTCDCGTIFKIDHTNGQESILHSFGANGDGKNPYYDLANNGTGHYLGSTASGGLYSQGAIFEFTP